MVTSGYMTGQAREELYRHVDAVNVDLKAFSERFYTKLTHAHLEPVLRTLQWLNSCTDVWLEITNLLIPNQNDSSDEIAQMCRWIVANLGDDVPLHFSAYTPCFEYTDSPQTPVETLPAPGMLRCTRV